MNDTVASAGMAWLLTYAVHSTALLGLAWLLVRARRVPPAAAEILWKSAMLGGILTATAQLQLDVRPAGSVSLRSARVAPAAHRQQPTYVHTSPGLATDESPAQSPSSEPIPPATDTAPRTIGMQAESIALTVWALVALALGVSYAARRLVLVGRLGERRRVEDERVIGILRELVQGAGLTTMPRLTTTERISSPIAFGAREICLPGTALTSLDVEQQRSMLAHELAHLTRRDPQWLAASSVIERLLWIQPLNRVARRHITTAAEFQCDDWVVRRTGSGVALAKCLAQVAEWIQASPLGVPVSGMAEERSLLVSRVARLLEGRLSHSRGRRWMMVSASLAILATIAIAPSVTRRSAAANVVEPEQESTGAPPTSVKAADSVVVIALIARLKDEDASVRRAAAQALGQLEDPRAVPGLIEALKDANKDVRKAAAESLGQFHDSRAITSLVASLSDSSPDVKRSAIEALSNYESGVPTTGVVRLLGDRDANVRARAAQLLGRMKDRSSSAALARLVRDSSADVRMATIEALAELHDPSSAAAILPALGDGKADVRERALNALSELKAAIGDATLISLLKDQSAGMRSRAAEIAGERSVVSAIPGLRRLVDDPNADVRQNAVRALGNIASPAAYEALRAALESKDANVRRAAVEALGERRP